MPTINRQSAPDLALIAILTLFASAGLIATIISAYYLIDTQNFMQTASAIGINAQPTGPHPFPTLASALTLTIFSITGALLAALCGTVLYNVPGMLKTVKEWQISGHLGYQNC